MHFRNSYVIVRLQIKLQLVPWIINIQHFINSLPLWITKNKVQKSLLVNADPVQILKIRVGILRGDGKNDERTSSKTLS